MACSGGRIVAVGSSDEVRRLGGADTREVDLKGLTVIPGLTDAHVHSKGYGYYLIFISQTRILSSERGFHSMLLAAP